MSYVLAAAGFAALIILHELGHFLAAKSVGMRVERFYLFFPPKLFSIQRGETEYGIGAIPLGGFVKITGMNPEELEEAERGAAGLAEALAAVARLPSESGAPSDPAECSRQAWSASEFCSRISRICRRASAPTPCSRSSSRC